MTDQNPLPKNNGKEASAKRARAVFPRLSLRKTLELPRVVYNIGEGEQVRRLTVFNKLGKSPDSGPSRTLITTANSGYGLVTGGQSADFIGLTDRGKIMISSDNDTAQYETALEVLFDNDIFTAFITKFNGKGLNDEVATDYLKATHRLLESDAKAALEVFKENIQDYGLIQEMYGKRIVISMDMAIENHYGSNTPNRPKSPTISVQNTDDREQVATVRDVTEHNPVSLRSRVAPQFHFNIQIHLPDSASPEVYDAIFKSIATHILGKEEEE